MANLIYHGNKANLPAIRNATSVYFCEDTRELYFGSNLYTEAVRFFTSTVEVAKPANPAQGVLYFDLKDNTGYAWDGSAWKTVIESPASIKAELIGDAQEDTYESDTIEGAKRYADKVKNEVLGTNSDTSASETVKGARLLAAEKVAGVSATANGGIEVDNTDDKNPTIGIKLSAKAGNELNIETGSGEEGLYHKSPVYTITKQATADDGYLATYQLFKDSAAVGDKINVPKDFLVKSAEIKTVSQADTPYEGAQAGDKYIDFVVNTKGDTEAETDQHIYLPVNELVDVYTAGNGIDISELNVVSVKLDTTNANGLETTAAGLKLNLATATNGATPATPGAMSGTDKDHLDAAYEAVTVGTF